MGQAQVQTQTQTQAQTLGEARFGVLDGLRGVAALGVLAAHASLVVGRTVAPHGYLAVDFFFALSGFVVAHAYRARLQAGLGLLRFCLIRLIRLYPLALAGVIAGLAASLIAHAPPPVDALRALACGAVLAPCDGLQRAGYGLWPLDPPTWSLFFELLANLVFVLFLVRRRRGVLAALTAVSAAGLVLAAGRFGSLEVGFLPQNLWAGFFRVGFSFSLGLLMQERHWRRGERPGFLALAAALALVLLWQGAANKALFDLPAVLALFPILLMLALKAPEVTGVQARLARWLGEISYPLYVLQWPVMVLAAFVADRMGADGAVRPVIAVIGAGIAVLVSQGALRLYDGPVRRRLTALLQS